MKCDYKATERGSLSQHIKSIHEGERYPCEKCDYKATQKGSLRQYIKSIHEGEQYPCVKCDYKATQNGSLRYFDVKTWIKLDIFSSWFMYLNHCTKNIQELLLSADQISQISQISWVGSVISQH